MTSMDLEPPVKTPWTQEQIDALNRFQQEGGMHPYTCGQREGHVGDDVLVATAQGWVCPHEGCDYTQGWAHGFSADPDIVETLAQHSAWFRRS